MLVAFAREQLALALIRVGRRRGNLTEDEAAPQSGKMRAFQIVVEIRCRVDQGSIASLHVARIGRRGAICLAVTFAAKSCFWECHPLGIQGV